MDSTKIEQIKTEIDDLNKRFDEIIKNELSQYTFTEDDLVTLIKGIIDNDRKCIGVEINYQIDNIEFDNDMVELDLRDREIEINIDDHIARSIVKDNIDIDTEIDESELLEIIKNEISKNNKS
jgi:hypothetical protein